MLGGGLITYGITNDTYSSLSMKCGSSQGVSTNSTVKYSKICDSADLKKAFSVIVNVVVKTISLSGTGRKMGLIIGNHGVSFLAYTIRIFSCSRIKVTHEKNRSLRVKTCNVVFKIFKYFREKVFI